MYEIFLSISNLIIGIVSKIIMPIILFFSGYNKAKAKSNEKIIKDINKANDIRDRLKRDDNFASRVRRRFTR